MALKWVLLIGSFVFWACQVQQQVEDAKERAAYMQEVAVVPKEIEQMMGDTDSIASFNIYTWDTFWESGGVRSLLSCQYREAGIERKADKFFIDLDKRIQ